MDKYQLPQFIDIEDKIIGPLTLKQFLYFLAAAMFLFILWTFLKFGAFIVVAVIVLAITVIFAFVKINGRPFSHFIGNLQRFILKQQKYTWRKESITPTKKKEESIKMVKVAKEPKSKTIPESKLEKLATRLDTSDVNSKSL